MKHHSIMRSLSLILCAVFLFSMSAFAAETELLPSEEISPATLEAVADAQPTENADENDSSVEISAVADEVVDPETEESSVAEVENSESVSDAEAALTVDAAGDPPSAPPTRPQSENQTNSEEPVAPPAKPASDETGTQGETTPPAPPADNNASVADAAEQCDYLSENLKPDQTTEMSVEVGVGQTVVAGLSYGGRDSSVNFTLSSNSAPDIVEASSSGLAATLTGKTAGAADVTVSWTATSTSGSVYTVIIHVTVSENAVETTPQTMPQIPSGGGGGGQEPPNGGGGGNPPGPPPTQDNTVTAKANEIVSKNITLTSGNVSDIPVKFAEGIAPSLGIDSISDPCVTAVASDSTITVSAAKVGTSVVTASWTDSATGDTYTVVLNVTVKDTSDAPAVDTSVGGFLFSGSSLMGGFNAGTFLKNDGYDLGSKNISMGGTVIGDFAAAQKDKMVAYDPNAIFINIGSVDLDRIKDGTETMEEMMENYEALLTALRDELPDAKIHVMAYYPCTKNTFRSNDLVNQANELVRALAEKLGLTYVDVTEPLKDEEGYLKSEYSADGIHLTDDAYALVYEELKPYIIAAQAEHRFLAGEHGTWSVGSDTTLDFLVDGKYSKFTSVRVDGKLLSAADYTSASGSTVLNLKPEYLNTLAEGEHTITVVFTDGDAATDFTVKAAANSGQNTTPTDPKPTSSGGASQGTAGRGNGKSTPSAGAQSPKTGDDTNITIWIALLLFSITGCVCCVIPALRKNN